MKLIKHYLDIEADYYGTKEGKEAYKDYHNWYMWLLGVLKLKVDTDKKTTEEISFKQFTWKEHKYLLLDDEDPNLSYYSEVDDCDLLISWNGRTFDLPIIILNGVSSHNRGHEILQRTIKNDRDLFDLCVLNKIDIKGGLGEVAKRLNINFNFSAKDIDAFAIKDKKKRIEAVTKRNEFDVRILPLIEEKLGYLYQPRNNTDNYQKNWG